MASSWANPLLGAFDETGDDFIDSYQLRAHFQGPFVEHHRRVSDISRGLRNQLEVKQWIRVQELGRGGFGTVWLERERGGTVRAVKEISKNTYKAKTIDYLREILAMANLSKEDAYFIQLHGWFQNPGYIYIAMEFAPYGDLQKCVSGLLPESEAQAISHQIVEALAIMHLKNFTHRDLKPSNVFVISRAPWWVKLGDFGVSKRMVDDRTFMRTSIETDFSAPEILGFVGVGPDESSRYTNAVDMWSLGCLVHWLLTLQLPLDRWQLLPFCMGTLPLPLHHLSTRNTSEEAFDFIQKLLCPQPDDRMTATAALVHGWPCESEETTIQDSQLPLQQQNEIHPHIQVVQPTIVRPRTPETTFSQGGGIKIKKNEERTREMQEAVAAKLQETGYPSLVGVDKTRLNGGKQPLTEPTQSISNVHPVSGRVRSPSVSNKEANDIFQGASVDQGFGETTGSMDSRLLPSKSPQGTNSADPSAVSKDAASEETSDVDSIDYDAIEAEFAAREAEEARREAEYQTKKAAAKEAKLQHEREEEAAYETSLSQREYEAEEQEDASLAARKLTGGLREPWTELHGTEKHATRDFASPSLNPWPQIESGYPTNDATAQLIGTRFNVLTKGGLRYLGILENIDAKESTITLKDVFSFGTESRDVQSFVAPEPLMWVSVTLQGADVKDIKAAEEAEADQVASKHAVAAYLGPPAVWTTLEAKTIFNDIGRLHPMRWQGERSSSMICSNDYLIQSPYVSESCRMLPGQGSTQGLEQVRKLLKMQRDRMALNPFTGVSREAKPAADVSHTKEFERTATSTNPALISKHEENTILKSFRAFTDAEKSKVAERRRAQAEANRTAKLNDLKRFHSTFKLKTPVPSDLVNIITKDPEKREDLLKVQNEHSHRLHSGKTAVASTHRPSQQPPSFGRFIVPQNIKSSNGGTPTSVFSSGQNTKEMYSSEYTPQRREPAGQASADRENLNPELRPLASQESLPPIVVRLPPSRRQKSSMSYAEAARRSTKPAPVDRILHDQRPGASPASPLASPIDSGSGTSKSEIQEDWESSRDKASKLTRNQRRKAAKSKKASAEAQVS